MPLNLTLKNIYNTRFSHNLLDFAKLCIAHIPLDLCNLDSAQLVTLVPVDVDVAVLLDQAQSTSVEQLGFGVPRLARLEM